MFKTTANLVRLSADLLGEVVMPLVVDVAVPVAKEVLIDPLVEDFTKMLKSEDQDSKVINSSVLTKKKLKTMTPVHSWIIMMILYFYHLYLLP